MFLKKLVRFITGDPITSQRDRLSSTMPEVAISSPLKKEGDRRGTGRGTFAGGVAWPVDESTHDGNGFITADAFPAEFIVSEQKVYLLDRVNPNVRHDGAEPLIVGNNVFLPKPLGADCVGSVIRTAEYGTEGLDQNVFFAHAPSFGGGQALVAHHLNPNPNVNSTPVYDPQEGSGVLPAIGPPGTQGQQIRKGFIDDQWRVGGFNPKWRAYASECPGKTIATPTFPPPDPNEKGGVYWNLGSSGVDPFRGHGMAWFDGSGQHMGLCAYLGYGFNGPLRPASLKHKLAEHSTGEMRAGALDLNTYWTWGSPNYDGPLDFEQVEEPDVIDPAGVPHRVHLQMDNDVCHPHINGPRSGKWRWHVRLPITKTPACTPLQPGEDPVQYQFDMGGDMPSPTYHFGYLMGVGSIGLPPPNVHLLAR